MPYGGTTTAEDAKIERCVAKLVADPNFKPRDSESKKVAAIKICKAQIMKSTEFDFSFEIEKATIVDRGDGRMVIRGVASSSSVDRDNEQMSQEAVQKMLEQINSRKIPLHNEHGRSWHDRIGEVVAGEIDDSGKLVVEAELNQKHPIAKFLYDKIKSGEQFGLSVAGKVKGFTQQMRTDLGKFVRTFHDILLKEISVTSRPANWDAMGLVAKNDWVMEIAKSVPEEAWIDAEKGHMMDEETTKPEVDETAGTDPEGTEAAETEETEEVAKTVRKKAKGTHSKTALIKRFERMMAQQRQEFADLLGITTKSLGGEESEEEEEAAEEESSETLTEDVVAKAVTTALKAAGLTKISTDDEPKGAEKITKAVQEVMADELTKRDEKIDELTKSLEKLAKSPLPRKGIAASGDAGDEAIIARKSTDNPPTASDDDADFKSSYIKQFYGQS